MPGGFGIRGTEGKILAANWARTKNVPYLGRGDFFYIVHIHVWFAYTSWYKNVDKIISEIN